MTSKTTRPRRKRSSTENVPPQPVGLRLFDCQDVYRRLHGGGIMASNGDEDSYGIPSNARFGREFSDDERGSWRSLIVPDEALIARIAALDKTCPQFGEVTAWIVRAATLAMAGGCALRLDPCVLLGKPGVGKTYYSRKLAEAFGVMTMTIPMNTVTDRGTWFSGLAPVWRASGPGKVAQLLIDCDCASPVVVIDEIEKSSPVNPAETPINVLHSLLEKENAARFQDEFLEVPIRADHIIWICTANDLSPLPASIVDRLIAFTITLAPGQMAKIQRSIFDEANAATGGLFSPPPDVLLDQVMAQTPRRMSRLWPIAFGFACMASRRHVTRTDLEQAQDILKPGLEHRSQIGFLHDIAPATAATSGPARERSKSRD